MSETKEQKAKKEYILNTLKWCNDTDEKLLELINQEMCSIELGLRMKTITDEIFRINIKNLLGDIPI